MVRAKGTANFIMCGVLWVGQIAICMDVKPHGPQPEGVGKGGVSRAAAKRTTVAVVGQGKCPGKCSAKMSLRYAAMVSDVDGLGTIRCFHPGGPPASR